MRLRALLAVLPLVALAACTNEVIKKQAPGTGEAPPEEDPGTSSGGPNRDWVGQPISATSDGEVVIVASPGAKRVTAKVEAEPKDTSPNAPTTQPTPFVTVDEGASAVKVTCNKAGTTGLGCKKLTVTVPMGKADMPVALTVTSGKGGIRVEGTLTVASLAFTAKGDGDIGGNVTPVAGATLSATSEGSIEIGVPATFAADEVVLSVPGNDSSRIDTKDFPGMQNGKPFGEVGAGAKQIKLQSTSATTADVVRVKRF
jgi:hypothetical protein